MALNAAKHLHDLLDAAAPSIGTSGATSGWGIFVAFEPKDPDTVITLYNSGGLPANPKWLFDQPSVQLRARGSVQGYLAAFDKIQEAKDFLLGHLPQTMGNGDKLRGITLLSDIADLGPDDNGRHQLSVNFRTRWEPLGGVHSNRAAIT